MNINYLIGYRKGGGVNVRDSGCLTPKTRESSYALSKHQKEDVGCVFIGMRNTKERNTLTTEVRP